jgi:hypothetical protein
MDPVSVHYDQLEQADFSATPIFNVKSKWHHNPESSVEGLYVLLIIVRISGIYFSTSVSKVICKM